MPKCKFCKQNMSYYIYVDGGIAHFFYFCSNVLGAVLKSFETESTGFGGRYIYCRNMEIDRNKKRLSLKQSEIGKKCWYCGKRLLNFVKPGGKIDILYMCPGVLNFIGSFHEQEVKPKKLEWKFYCQLTQRARELIGKSKHGT